ncbi:MAG: histidine kinase [Actinomycetota bacterium]|nr:histidine kinase [Actinomycetota bacterium]
MRLRELAIDGVFERLYRTFGPRYIDAIKAAVWAAICLVVTPGFVALLTAPWEPTTGEFLRCLAAYELMFGLFAGPGTFVIARRAAPATFRWVGGNHAPADARAAWESTVAGLPRWMGITCAWWLLWGVPASFYTAATLDVAWYGYPIYLAGMAGTVGVVGIFGYLLLEQALRPLVREIAGHLPPDGAPPRSVMTLGVKALVLVPAINFFSAAVVGLLVVHDLGPELYLGHILLLAVVVSLTLSLILTLMFRNSVLRRVEDLREAMHRVDEGDLATRVAPLAGDELDDMGASFNEMVGGLLEREFLREHNADLVADLRRQADQLRDSRARIVAASDEARRDVERDLHDGAQQRLVLLGLKLTMASARAQSDPAGVTADLEELRTELDAALSELRELAHGIYPTILASEGVAAALREAAQRVAIPTRIDCDGTERYPAELEAAAYFCCLEAMQNSAKHGGGDVRVRVRLTHGSGELAFAVSDDGRGFDPDGADDGAGLQNMNDRIGALGGTLRVDSAPGAGTTISGTLPLVAAGRDDDGASRQRPRTVSAHADT